MGKSGANIVVKPHDVEHVSAASANLRKHEVCEDAGCSETNRELFLRENRSEVVRIDCRIITSPLFRVDIPLSSKSVWLSAEATRVETDDEIKGG